VFRSTEKLSENTVFLGPALLTVSFTFSSENLLVRETKIMYLLPPNRNFLNS